MARPSNAQLQANREKLLMNWEKLNTEKARITALEKEARLAVVDAFGNDDLVEGTNTFDLTNPGFKLKIKQPYTRKLDEGVFKSGVLPQVAEGTFDKIVVSKLSISVTGYKRLDDATRAILDEAVTTTPGSASLEITQPKR
jgi:hypothetical protein